jgi:chromate reductase, NAD(P)H dehydrogenase (quinone)
MPRILFFAGSSRTDSLNKKLARYASTVAKEAGADVTVIDLKDFEMPLYNGDQEAEQGIPENAKRLKQIFVEHDGFFIASPEYNSSFSPLLKNTLDWLTRPHQENETPLSAYAGKVAALGAISPGALGGIRGLVPLRMMLNNIMVTVVPMQAAISFGLKAFDETENLQDEGQKQMLEKTIRQLVDTAKALSQDRL